MQNAHDSYEAGWWCVVHNVVGHMRLSQKIENPMS